MFIFIIPKEKRIYLGSQIFVETYSSRLTVAKEDEEFIKYTWARYPVSNETKESFNKDGNTTAVFIISPSDDYYRFSDYSISPNYILSIGSPEPADELTIEWVAEDPPVRDGKWFLKFCGKNKKINYRGGRGKLWKNQKGRPQRKYLRR